MKRSLEESDVFGGRRPAPPGIAGSHPASAIPGHSTGFPHVLTPAPGQLAHSFEQMRDNLSRPPFSSHVPGTTLPNPQPVAPGHMASSQNTTHAAKPTYQTHLQTPTSGHATAAGQQQYQRLKSLVSGFHLLALDKLDQSNFNYYKGVEDALSYLDQVKLQFGNQPQVYNEFLDIMKEFKSQTIDTPGVISRVSALFKGHPDLIVGFNTFLPPGYKIEVSLTDINTVSVCAPNGTTTHLISGNGLIAAPTQPSQNKTPSSGHIPPAATSSVTPITSSTTATTSAPKSPTRSTTLNVKPTSPSISSIVPTLSLPSPGVQSQTQAQHHAINYVTKIKNRFQGQPEVYQKFLDILNNYQTEQKAIKENAVDQYGRPLQEQDVYVKEGKLASEVYAQVAKLFNKQEDLLQEFSQFLPDATGSSFNPSAAASLSATVTAYQPLSKKSASSSAPSGKASGTKAKKSLPSSLSLANSTKSEPMDVDVKDNGDKHLNKKRHKSALKDVSLAEAVKHGNLSEFAFFEKVRKALKSPEVYENFLRCLVLFNQEVITRTELIQLASSFLGKFPDLFSWFRMFLGYKDHQQAETNVTGFKDRGTGGELAHLEIDFASCKRSGASYRALPKSYTQPKCSGRTQLCKELLNDTWVSLPSWSEDTQFPGTRKTQYEEYIYKCEDERFELDGVIEMNLSTIKVLEGVQKKFSRMSSEEQQKFRLDNCLGGCSEVIHRKAIHRIYGDKSAEVIDGLKKTPHVAIPLVLKRLKQKDEEWRLAQKQFNKIWREQNEKYYLKSLDHQGINFKQNDLKAIRSKSLIRDIEQIFEERSDQMEDGNAEVSAPHFTFTYQDHSTLEDASALIIHHMKRQAGIHKEDKTKIKSILLQFLQELFFAPQGNLSDDEQDVDEENESNLDKNEKIPTLIDSNMHDMDDFYKLIFVNNSWYILIRLHQMLCERLLKMFHLAMKVAKFEAQDKKYRREGTAEALRLKKPGLSDVEEYYPAFLDMVKNLLDGQLDPNGYEDTLRETFGVNAYISFTMDKLIQNLVRQLNNIVTDDVSMKLMEIYYEEKANNATGGSSVTATMRSNEELVYQKKIENLLVEENCFKVYFYKDKGLCKMSVELLPSEDDQSDDQVETERWSEYMEKYVAGEDIAPELKEHLSKKPIFLLRNARILQKRHPDQEADKKSSVKDSDAMIEESADDVNKINHFPDLIVNNRLECKISLNSYKMRYVSGTSDFLYRQDSLIKCKKNHPNINVRLHDAYSTVHSQWLHENTTREQCRQAEEWLLGKATIEDMLPCLTTKDTGQAAGLAVSKYSVVYTKDFKQTVGTSSVTSNPKQNVESS